MNSIAFLSRSRFLSFIGQEDLDSSNIAFVSVSDTVEEESDMIAPLSSHDHHITCVFSDVEKGNHGEMSMEIAQKIVEFVDSHSEKDFVIHCFAGISRSGAIAKWVNWYLGRELFELTAYTGHNKHVYDMLDRVIGNSMSAYYEDMESESHIR